MLTAAVFPVFVAAALSLACLSLAAFANWRADVAAWRRPL
jgi:hypothetical protein